MEEDECRFLKTIDIGLSVDANYTTWQVYENFLIFGTNTGSLLFYDILTLKSCGMIATSEIMEPLTKISVFPSKSALILLIGTKKGTLAFVEININLLLLTKQIKQWRSGSLIDKLGSEFVDIFVGYDSSFLIIITQKAVMYCKMKMNEKDGIIISEKKLCFDCPADIIQASFYEKRVLVTTLKTYYIVDIFSNESKQVGSKEKNGPLGSTFFSYANEVNVFAARINGVLWKASINDGKVLKSVQYMNEREVKPKFGLLYSTKDHIISVNGKKLLVLSPISDTIIIEQEFEESIEITVDATWRKDAVSNTLCILHKRAESTITLKKLEFKKLQECFNFYIEKGDLSTALSSFEEYSILQTLNNAASLMKLCEMQNKDLRTMNSRIASIIEELEDNSWRLEQENYHTVVNKTQSLPLRASSTEAPLKEGDEYISLESNKQQGPKKGLREYNQYIRDKIEYLNFRIELCILYEEGITGLKQLLEDDERKMSTHVKPSTILRIFLKIPQKHLVKKFAEICFYQKYTARTKTVARFLMALFGMISRSSYELVMENSFVLGYIVAESKRKVEFTFLEYTEQQQQRHGYFHTKLRKSIRGTYTALVSYQHIF